MDLYKMKTNVNCSSYEFEKKYKNKLPILSLFRIWKRLLKKWRQVLYVISNLIIMQIQIWSILES